MFNSEFEKNSPFTLRQATMAMLIYIVGYFIVIPTMIHFAVLWGWLQNQHILLASGVLSTLVLVAIVLVMQSLATENVYQWTSTKRVQETLRNLMFIFVALFIFNSLLSLVTDLSTSENQLTIIEVFRQSPMYIIFLAVVFAPIVEEVIFRGIVYRSLRYLKFKWFAVFVSTFLFGLIHVTNAVLMGRFEDAWFIIVYMAIGFFMIRIYEHSGDILSPILLHMGYNAIAVLVMYLI